MLMEFRGDGNGVRSGMSTLSYCSTEMVRKRGVFMRGKPLMRRMVLPAVLWNGAEDDGPVNSR